MSSPSWPERLWLIRHGQSEGNVADEAAQAAGSHEVRLATRDADVPLTRLGQEQAAAVGRVWVDGQAAPELVVTSPFVRAQETTRLATQSAGLALVPQVDERLRERDLGIFEGLTPAGIRARYPEETERRARLGKFYYRPPGGESWADLALRVRAFVSDLRTESGGLRVAVFSHQAVLLVFRYLLEGLTEAQVLQVDRTTPFRNCAVTEYAALGDAILLARHDAAGHLAEVATPATESRSTRAAV